jgi:hypothetical protein
LLSNRILPVALTVLGAAVVIVAATWLAFGHRPSWWPHSAAGGGAPARPSARCGLQPHTCGFPDSTNTGVPRGTVLRSVPGQAASGPGWHYDPRGWVEVDGQGAVVSGLFFHCNVNVAASNVTLTGDRIETTGNGFGVSVRHTQNVTIENSDIYSPYADSRRLMAGVKDIFGDSTGLKVLRNNIWHTGTGVQLEAGLVEGNYIHAAGYAPGDHINGITSNGGVTRPLTIRGNTILIDRTQTDAVGLFEDFGVQANRVIEDNLLAGGGYAIYGGTNKGKPAAYNITIRGNVISRIFYPNGGYYGQIAHFNRAGRGAIWSGNHLTGVPRSPAIGGPRAAGGHAPQPPAPAG